MVIHHIFGVERQLLLVHSAYFLNDFLFVPYAALSHFFRIKSGGIKSLIPIAENPNALLVQMLVIILQISGKNLAVLFINGLHRSNPVVLTMRVKAATRTLYRAKVLCDQFVRREFIFLHVSFAVGVVLGKVPAADHAAMVA